MNNAQLEQIGIGMVLVGTTGILIIMGKWIYECQGIERNNIVRIRGHDTHRNTPNNRR
jgi:hypothetical protein|nr:MAG TPA: hypothetical protein [Caudoviricetes sp.]